MDEKWIERLSCAKLFIDLDSLLYSQKPMLTSSLFNPIPFRALILIQIDFHVMFNENYFSNREVISFIGYLISDPDWKNFPHTEVLGLHE